MKEEVKRWLKQAEHDLEMARKNYQIEGYDICLILCQGLRKAEKAEVIIKGMLG